MSIFWGKSFSNIAGDKKKIFFLLLVQDLYNIKALDRINLKLRNNRKTAKYEKKNLTIIKIINNKVYSIELFIQKWQTFNPGKTYKMFL